MPNISRCSNADALRQGISRLAGKRSITGSIGLATISAPAIVPLASGSKRAIYQQPLVVGVCWPKLFTV